MIGRIHIEIEGITDPLRAYKLNFSQDTSKGFIFKLEMSSNSPDLASVKGKILTISIANKIYLRGYIHVVELNGGTWAHGDEIGYDLTVYSEDHLLANDSQYIRYDDQPAFDHVRSIFMDRMFDEPVMDFAFPEDRVISACAPGTELLNYHQQDENTRQSIHNICGFYGISYFYDVTLPKCPVVLIDTPMFYHQLQVDLHKEAGVHDFPSCFTANETHTQKPLPKGMIAVPLLSDHYNVTSLDPGIYEYGEKYTAAPNHVTCYGYDADQAHLDILSSSWVNPSAPESFKNNHHIGHAVTSQSETDRLVQLGRSALFTKSRLSQCKGTGWINVGDVFQLTNTANDAFSISNPNGQWFVKSVDIELSTASDNFNMVSNCNFSAEIIPFDPSVTAFELPPEQLTSNALTEGFTVAKFDTQIFSHHAEQQRTL